VVHSFALHIAPVASTSKPLRRRLEQRVADYVYPPVIISLKTAWRYLGLKFDFKGTENLPQKGGAVICMNHVGYLDFALVGTAALPAKRYIRFMAKKEIFDHKIGGPLMRGMHHISVDRESGTSSFVAALRALRSGEIIGIFPEGTISRSFEIDELKSGAVRLSMGAGVPIIPAAVWGSQRIMTKKRKPDFKRRKFPIHVAFGEPYTVPKGSDVDAAEADLKERMSQLLDSVQANYPDTHVGQWWAPARLGGTAPTIEQVHAEREQ
jgi:1-acyl-sn-glycerol-3-phosphate acyltransferase